MAMNMRCAPCVRVALQWQHDRATVLRMPDDLYAHGQYSLEAVFRNLGSTQVIVRDSPFRGMQARSA